MLKKFFCGAVLVASLTFAGPAQANELYVRNRPFGDAYHIGNAAYVPVESFLKAVEVPWSTQGSTVVLGRGSSPSLTATSDRVTFNADGRQASLLGIVKDNQLYVPAAELARLVGYGVVHNEHTGVTDVVKAHEITALERKIAAQVKEEAEARAAERKAKWQERVAKFRAEKEAREAAEAEAEGGDDEDEDEDEFFDDEGDPDDEGNKKKKPKKPKKTEKADDEDAEVAEAPAPAEDKDDEEDKTPPPQADLVVLSSEANPNTYTGEVIFRAVVQNQGFATATDVKANLTVVGPDGKTWLSKTLYHGPIAADGRWEITEQYKHRLGGQAVTDQNGQGFNVSVKPTFNSAPPPEKK